MLNALDASSQPLKTPSICDVLCPCTGKLSFEIRALRYARHLMKKKIV